MKIAGMMYNTHYSTSMLFYLTFCTSDFTVSEDAGHEPRTDATFLALTIRRSITMHSARSHPMANLLKKFLS
jgi:hypothetical protein